MVNAQHHVDNLPLIFKNGNAVSCRLAVPGAIKIHVLHEVTPLACYFRILRQDGTLVLLTEKGLVKLVASHCITNTTEFVEKKSPENCQELTPENILDTETAQPCTEESHFWKIKLNKDGNERVLSVRQGQTEVDSVSSISEFNQIEQCSSTKGGCDPQTLLEPFIPFQHTRDKEQLQSNRFGLEKDSCKLFVLQQTHCVKLGETEGIICVLKKTQTYDPH